MPEWAWKTPQAIAYLAMAIYYVIRTSREKPPKRKNKRKRKRG
jgi:hypothetical protein